MESDCTSRAKPLTSLQNRIMLLAAEGKNRKEIIDETHCSISYLTEVIGKYSIRVTRTTWPHKYDYAAIANMRNNGMSYGEIAKQLGKPSSAIAKLCRYLGLTGARRDHRLSVESVKDIVSRAGFEYIDGFKTVKSNITVKCPKCGKAFMIYYHTLSDYVNGTCNAKTVRCKECKKDEALKKAENLKVIKEQEAQQRIEFRQRKKAAAEADKKKRYEQVRICQKCGTPYTISQTGYNSTLYCSIRCQKSHGNKLKKDKRLKKFGVSGIEKSITLERVFTLDMGICYICGSPCDWNDISEDINGTIIAGDSYPSIDHIIPLSKGGEHTWDNVRLAHRICNSLKRDRIADS